jgi:hypothetical protein
MSEDLRAAFKRGIYFHAVCLAYGGDFYAPIDLTT